ncbi:MAG: hypothetical protein H5T99_06100 [Moorella sp. (in: Bacteria)]|nr:hypothetical protein [Moorella sp. (in: firmicutes)]
MRRIVSVAVPHVHTSAPFRLTARRENDAPGRRIPLLLQAEKGEGVVSYGYRDVNEKLPAGFRGTSLPRHQYRDENGEKVLYRRNFAGLVFCRCGPQKYKKGSELKCTRPQIFWEEKHNNLFGAVAVGMTAFGGGLWLVPLPAFKGRFTDERQAAAALLALMAALFLAGFPAGWLGGKSFPKSPLPVWAAMAGAYLVPVAAWFAGLEPAWPAYLAWAWGLSFAGSWAGLVAGFLLQRQKACR